MGRIDARDFCSPHRDFCSISPRFKSAKYVCLNRGGCCAGLHYCDAQSLEIIIFVGHNLRLILARYTTAPPGHPMKKNNRSFMPRTVWIYLKVSLDSEKVFLYKYSWGAEVSLGNYFHAEVGDLFPKLHILIIFRFPLKPRSGSWWNGVRGCGANINRFRLVLSSTDKKNWVNSEEYGVCRSFINLFSWV